jgi:Outer membrane protein beta-barrel domain
MKSSSVLLLLLNAAALLGQGPKYELRGSVGAVQFLDDGSWNHLLLASSFRYYFRRNLAVEGEFQYLYQNDTHHDIVLLPSFVWDIRQGRVVPYLSVGLGWARGSFQRFSTAEEFLQGGGGVKIYLNDHWYVAPEFKFGLDLHGRLSGTLGYTRHR